jgi:hypothetical protein
MSWPACFCPTKRVRLREGDVGAPGRSPGAAMLELRCIHATTFSMRRRGSRQGNYGITGEGRRRSSPLSRRPALDVLAHGARLASSAWLATAKTGRHARSRRQRDDDLVLVSSFLVDALAHRCCFRAATVGRCRSSTRARRARNAEPHLRSDRAVCVMSKRGTDGR